MSSVESVVCFVVCCCMRARSLSVALCAASDTAACHSPSVLPLPHVFRARHDVWPLVLLQALPHQNPQHATVPQCCLCSVCSEEDTVCGHWYFFQKQHESACLPHCACLWRATIVVWCCHSTERRCELRESCCTSVSMSTAMGLKRVHSVTVLLHSLSLPWALGSVVLWRQHSHTLVPTDAGEPFSTEPEDVVRVPSFPMHRHVRCAHCLT